MAIKAELKVANEAEAQAGWARVGATPTDLAIWFTKVFSIAITESESSNPIFVSSSEPEEDSDKGKPFFNSSTPASISVPLSGGTYATFYQYPPHVPLLWTAGDDARPSYLRRLSPTELTKMGLTNPEESEYYYVIFTP